MAIIYVKSSSTGNGSAWNNAYGSLASAITAKLCRKINNVLDLISGFTLATAGMLQPPISVPEPSNLIGFITLSGLMLGNAVKKARKSG
jgi:hypothetical protein